MGVLGVLMMCCDVMCDMRSERGSDFLFFFFSIIIYLFSFHLSSLPILPAYLLSIIYSIHSIIHTCIHPYIHTSNILTIAPYSQHPPRKKRIHFPVVFHPSIHQSTRLSFFPSKQYHLHLHHLHCALPFLSFPFSTAALQTPASTRSVQQTPTPASRASIGRSVGRK